MRKASLEFLETLCNTPSPSGHETRGQRAWLDYVSPFVEETYSDAYGNCVAVLNKGGSPRLMLAAHADEIALTVSFISEEGFIYVRRLGGVDPSMMKAQRIVVHSRKGPVPGVIGNVAPHLTKNAKENGKTEIQDLFIDIGAADRADAQKRVRVGDPITLTDEFMVLREHYAVARGLDNRSGTFAVAETMRLLAKSGKGLKAEVCAVSNIMEEIGLLGARQITYSLHPDLALVVDVTHATDCPTVSKPLHGDIRLGAGPSVTHGGCNHPEIIARLESVAAKGKIPLQHEASSSTSGTDADVIFWTRGGIPCGLVSLPNRYMHSPVEMVDLNDLVMIPQLMAAFAGSLKKDDVFKVRI